MSDELGEAARRGLQRAAIHLMKAAIEVVEGISAFLEEMQHVDGERGSEEGPPEPEHIEVE